MRSAGNFSPEWGYLAPAPSFMRTARVVLVATAIGATAGAVVVLSLVDRATVEGEKSLVAAHAIVTSVQAATATTIPLTAMPVAAAAPTAPVATVSPVVPAAAASATVITVIPANAPATLPSAAPIQKSVRPQPVIAPRPTTMIAPPAANDPQVNASTADPAMAPPRNASSGIAALSDTSQTSDAASSDLPDGTTLGPEMGPKKPSKHPATANAKGQPGLGSVLRRMFSSRSGTSYYPAR
jgi:hypothetical protein